ncbi:hypothetical protein COOONC_23844 [Cooperia oncophora]
MSLKLLENGSIRRSFCHFYNAARNVTTMEGTSGNSVPDLRESMALPPNFDYRVWFPMHMSVQMKKMEGKLRSVDLIVEVHELPFIPISGRNSTFLKQFCSIRPHVLVMNKMDLINLKKYKFIRHFEGEP